MNTISNEHFNNLKICYANSMQAGIKCIDGNYSFSDNLFKTIDFKNNNKVVIYDGEEIEYQFTNKQYKEFLKACKDAIKRDHSKDFYTF